MSHRKISASILTAALLIAAPGLPCYQALAATEVRGAINGGIRTLTVTTPAIGPLGVVAAPGLDVGIDPMGLASAGALAALQGPVALPASAILNPPAEGSIAAPVFLKERTAAAGLGAIETRVGAAAQKNGTSGGAAGMMTSLKRFWDGAPAALSAGASAAVLGRLRDARARGTAVVVYSTDLDELLSLADRIVVVHAGDVREIPLDRDTIGRAMLGG